ncbi:MAG TPA: Uma2 family endonuclease [Armatimonadota bacterium]|nr:Uma2 family endonuclease [Armatimonadota bacterium]
MSVDRAPYLTPAEYLEIERKAETKSEYYDGEMFAMSGASRQHNRITLDVATALNAALMNTRCEPFSTDMRVKVTAAGLYAYPDVVVVCDEPEFEDQELDTLLNPTLIIEVLSTTTEAWDRGRKFELYRSVESLKEYVLIDQNRPHVERYLRQGETWVLTELSDLNAELELPSVGCRIALKEIYRRVPFDEPQ